MKMSELTEKDIGRKVMYTGKFKIPEKCGTIKTWDDKYVHVFFSFRPLPIKITSKELKFI